MGGLNGFRRRDSQGRSIRPCSGVEAFSPDQEQGCQPRARLPTRSKAATVFNWQSPDCQVLQRTVGNKANEGEALFVSFATFCSKSVQTRHARQLSSRKANNHVSTKVRNSQRGPNRQKRRIPSKVRKSGTKTGNWPRRFKSYDRSPTISDF
jgi:hypothetical protein